MDTNSLVSIVIPVYNTGKYLAEAIDSVINQTYKNIEIILVDDGSTDNSPAICDTYAADYENIYAIHKTNGGASTARNIGIEKAAGEYVIFFDSDDILLEEAVSTLVKKAKDGDFDAVYPDRYTIFFENTKKSELRFHFDKSMYMNDPKKFALDVLIQKGRAWRASALLYKLSVIKENNVIFPVGIISEDMFFNLQFLSFANNIVCLDFITLIYRKHDNSITANHTSDFFQTILRIDDTAREFLINNKLNTTENNIKCDSLLMRNVCTYLISVMSKKNAASKSEKNSYFNEIINNERVAAVDMKKIHLPYFYNKRIIFLYRIMYKLIYRKWYYCLKILAMVVSKL